MSLLWRRQDHRVLTRLGIETRDKLRESFFEPPHELMELDADLLQTLSAALKYLPFRRPVRREMGMLRNGSGPPGAMACRRALAR